MWRTSCSIFMRNPKKIQLLLPTCLLSWRYFRFSELACFENKDFLEVYRKVDFRRGVISVGSWLELDESRENVPNLFEALRVGFQTNQVAKANFTLGKKYSTHKTSSGPKFIKTVWILLVDKRMNTFGWGGHGLLGSPGGGARHEQHGEQGRRATGSRPPERHARTDHGLGYYESV